MSLYTRGSRAEFWDTTFPDEFIRNCGMLRDDWVDIHVALFHLEDETLDFMESELNSNFRLYWIPHRRVVIDESMRLFKGHWRGKVYIKNKPTKWGLKYYLMVDEECYCTWFVLYKGKAANPTSTSSAVPVENDEKSKAPSKTRILCNTAIDSLPKDMGAYAIYVDNYYGSLDLAYDTHERGFAFTFNCRSNRPSWLFDDLGKNMEPYEGIDKFAIKVNKEVDMAALSWKDKKQVNYLTNQFVAQLAVVWQKQHGEEEKSLKFVPKTNQDYSENGMGHVDTVDASLSRFTHIRNVSWRRTHFSTMLKLSLVNAHVLYTTWLEQNGYYTKAQDMQLKDYLKLVRNEIHENSLRERKIQTTIKEDKRRAKKTLQQQIRREKAKKESQESHFRVQPVGAPVDRAKLMGQYIAKYTGQ